jgi:hexokinase
MTSLKLTIDQLCNVSINFKRETKKGLTKKDAIIKCLPSFIPPPQQINNGQVYVIELGGSNLRTALISIKNGEASFLDGPIEIAMPWERNRSFPKEKFLKIQADALASLKSGDEEFIGYCFSFPTEPLPNQDARLINWTKGLVISNMIGYEVGKTLLSYITSHYNMHFKRICVVNDAIATLFSGLNNYRRDGLIGLILGTGNNMATFLDIKNIPKMRNVPYNFEKIPVNLESGNFNIPYLSKWDEVVDNKSENKGMHLFEKAVSGMYLGRVFKAIFPDSSLDPEKGAKGLVDMLNNPENIKEEYISTARHIYKRSSSLIAASLAGIISLLIDHHHLNEIYIIGEGRLFWSKVDGMGSYSTLVQKTLTTLIYELGLPRIDIVFPEITNSTLIGSAIATLS